jgi:serine/threonine protein kinase
MNTELATVAQQIGRARCPEDVFGVLSGSPEEQLRAARLIFHSLSKVIHPDRYALSADKQVAHRTMARLNGLWAEARTQIALGRYIADRASIPTMIHVRTRKRAYDVGTPINTDEVCQHFACQFEMNSIIQSGEFKIARTPNDNDLVRAEAQVLRHLHADQNFERLRPFVPEIFDSFLYDDGRTAPRQANIVSRTAKLHSLEEVRAEYPRGVDPKDMAWVWRKLLIALGFAHARSIIHGAVLPPHVLIEPDQHGLILDNWVYALQEPFESDMHLTAIVSAYEMWYPPEVFAKQPPLPSLDIFMGARCMVYLLGGDPITGELPVAVPQAIASFFRGCLLSASHYRPQQAWDLLNEFTQLIERLWGPRTFRPFAMPAR